ncbi:hypothetical protein [Blastococcus sp. SYSU D00695]
MSVHAAVRPGPGALDALLGTEPTFRGALRGYDRMEVDNYVAWAETEIAVARRENDHLLTRFSACSAELADARRRLAGVDRGDADPVQELLVRAAEHAAALTAAAEAEADRIRGAARAEARARLANVAVLRQAVAAVRDETLATLAAERRDRAAAERESAGRIAALEAEVERLRRERDAAHAASALLGERIEDALQVVTAGVPDLPRPARAS